MNRQVVFFPFNSSWTGNDLLIAKPLDQSYVDLILQLLTYVTDSQKLLRDLLIVCQKLDYCQLPVVFLSNCEQAVLSSITLSKTQTDP